MHQLLNPLVLLILYVFVKAGDVTQSAARTNNVPRMFIYGFVAVLALLYLYLTLR